MQYEHDRYLKIPPELQPSKVRRALSSGHGYRWILLSSRTKSVYYGDTKRPNMPQLRMIDNQLIIEGYDSQYLDSIERIITALKSVWRGSRYE